MKEIDHITIEIPLTEWQEMQSRIFEIHEFAKDLAETLESIGKNPMLAAMIPGGLIPGR